ncbi:MAG: succinate--CoA ligase subunit beta, partial [Candidatus Heimdallarchaeota archaeon]|nr:succinate--CoA ligase subunit beta [Candidatus Heimdallarchaeota archaeon]
MKLYEYEAKQIFEKFGLTVPKKIGIIENVSDLETLSLNFPIMIKAMVLIGGRGKAGGIKKVDNVEEARDSCSKMLGLTIHGYAIKKLL